MSSLRWRSECAGLQKSSFPNRLESSAFGAENRRRVLFSGHLPVLAEARGRVIARVNQASGGT